MYNSIEFNHQVTTLNLTDKDYSEELIKNLTAKTISPQEFIRLNNARTDTHRAKLASILSANPIKHDKI